MAADLKLDDLLMEKSVFIFDLDGTLIDSIGAWNVIDRDLVKKFTGIDVPLTKIKNDRDYILGISKNDNPYRDYIRFLVENYAINLSLEEFNSYRKAESLESVIALKPYAKELIDYLKSSGMTLALATVSNLASLNYYRNIYPHTRVLNFDQVFQTILTMEDVESYKPNPEIYIKALRILGVDAKKTIVIEDSPVGVDAAISAGIDVIVVADENSLDQKEYLKKQATYYAESLGEILENCRKIGKKLEKSIKNS